MHLHEVAAQRRHVEPLRNPLMWRGTLDAQDPAELEASTSDKCTGLFKNDVHRAHDRHGYERRRTYMMAAPPGTDMTATGNGCASRLVTVRPAMIPTDAPKTASLSQWRFAGSLETAT